MNRDFLLDAQPFIGIFNSCRVHTMHIVFVELRVLGKLLEERRLHFSDVDVDLVHAFFVPDEIRNF